MSRQVAVLDYGSGNVRSVVRMLERVGARVELTADPVRVARADGLYVPGVGNFHACMSGLEAVDGPRLIRERLTSQAPVLGVCVGMQVLFEGSDEPTQAATRPGLGLLPGRVAKLRAPVVPHMGWSQVRAAQGAPPASLLTDAGLVGESFYFVHSYAVPYQAIGTGPDGSAAPSVAVSEHGDTFLAMIEQDALAATQFHPEKSGDTGARLLEQWLTRL